MNREHIRAWRCLTKCRATFLVWIQCCCCWCCLQNDTLMAKAMATSKPMSFLKAINIRWFFFSLNFMPYLVQYTRWLYFLDILFGAPSLAHFFVDWLGFSTSFHLHGKWKQNSNTNKTRCFKKLLHFRTSSTFFHFRSAKWFCDENAKNVLSLQDWDLNVCARLIICTVAVTAPMRKEMRGNSCWMDLASWFTLNHCGDMSYSRWTKHIALILLLG